MVMQPLQSQGPVTGAIAMRTNLPVTPVEKVYDEAVTLISKTDLKGRITFVNEAFVEISG